MLLFVAYGWSEAAFGPSQSYGTSRGAPDDPLRVAAGIQLVTAGLFCFAVAMLGLRPRLGSRVGHIGAALAYAAMALFVVGSLLWWPLILLRLSTQYGPLAGAPLALGTLCLIGAVILRGGGALLTLRR